MVHYKLTYFDGRGLTECARQLFALADQQYEDVRLSKEQFASIKDKMPFGQIPDVEVDGKQLAQSQAINCYLAKTFGFAGKDAFESAVIDSLVDQYMDYRAEIEPYFHSLLSFIPGDLDKLKKDAMMPACKKFLGIVAKFLKNAASSGFLVGNSLSWVDVVIAEHVSDISKSLPDYLDGYPEVKAHMEKDRLNPKLKNWFNKRPETSF
ncbi:hypothetical protein KIN20_026197 [Parelaphostrongylus tenuis]|uniref:glutathione transferase n=1 Tax=Parelaphostrongylus tenuis TaxID=148309 RepID=A0AAD5N9L8_PARTN|nr:hypothetical protein KIN20_026197 [Parelaphostrongylus tenuis]